MSDKLKRTSSKNLRNSIIRTADTVSQASAVTAASTGALGIAPVSAGAALVGAILAAISHGIKGKSKGIINAGKICKKKKKRNSLLVEGESCEFCGRESIPAS